MPKTKEKCKVEGCPRMGKSKRKGYYSAYCGTHISQFRRERKNKLEDNKTD